LSAGETHASPLRTNALRKQFESNEESNNSNYKGHRRQCTAILLEGILMPLSLGGAEVAKQACKGDSTQRHAICVPNRPMCDGGAHRDKRGGNMKRTSHSIAT
jgi:hypothetical protein